MTRYPFSTHDPKFDSSAQSRRKKRRGAKSRKSRFESLERRELLAAEMLPALSDPEPFSRYKLNQVYGSLNLLGGVGDQLAEGLNSLESAGDATMAAGAAIQLLGLEGVPLVDQTLGELSGLPDKLREISRRATSPPTVDFQIPADGAAAEPTFGELAAGNEHTINVIADSQLYRFTIPAFAPTGGTESQRAESWAAQLNLELESPAYTQLNDLVEFNADGTTLQLVSKLDTAGSPLLRQLSVTTVAIELPMNGVSLVGQSEGNISLNLSFTLSTLAGQDDSAETEIEVFPESDPVKLLLRSEPLPEDPSEQLIKAAVVSDNYTLQMLADDYNETFENTPAPYPEGAFTDGEERPTVADPTTPAGRRLSTYFEAIVDDGRTAEDESDDSIVLVSVHPDVSEFAIDDYFVNTVVGSSFDASRDETAFAISSILGMRGQRGRSGIDENILRQLDGTKEGLANAISQLMLSIDAADFSWNHETELLEYTIQSTANLSEASQSLVDADFSRSFDVGVFGDVEVVGELQLETAGNVMMDLSFELDLSDSGGREVVDGMTSLKVLDGGRGIRKIVGIVAENPPVNFTPAGESIPSLSLTITGAGPDIGTFDLPIPVSELTEGNRTLSDLANDFNKMLTVDHPLADRVEFAAVAGVLHLRAIDPMIESMELASIIGSTVATTNASGFRPGQASYHTSSTLGRVPYPELVIIGDDDGTPVPHYIDLDTAQTIDDVQTAIQNQTGFVYAAILVDDEHEPTSSAVAGVPNGFRLEVTGDALEFVVESGKAFGLRSFVAEPLGITDKSIPSTAVPGTHLVAGHPLTVAPTTERFYLKAPEIGQDSLAVDFGLKSEDISIGASLGFIEAGLEYSSPTDPDAMLFTLAMPLDVQMDEGESRIRVDQFLRNDPDDVYAPVESLKATFDTAFEINADVFGIEGDLGSVRLFTTDDNPSDVQFEFQAPTDNRFIENLKNLDVAGFLNVAQQFITQLNATVGDSAALNAEIPLINASINDVLDFADQLLSAINGVADSIDPEALAVFVDQVETRITNLDTPQSEKRAVRRALQGVRRELNKDVSDDDEDQQRIKQQKRNRRVIAAVSQLELEIVSLLTPESAPAARSVTARDDSHADVSGDGIVSPKDALQIINRIAAMHAETEDASIEADTVYDTNRDGRITPGDALLVINALQRQSLAIAAEAELPDVETLEPLQQRLVEALGELKTELPSINDLAARIERAVQDALPDPRPGEPSATFNFDLVDDFGPDDRFAVIAGLEAEFAFGPYEFNPDFNLLSLGPVSLDVGADLELEGKIDLDIGFGVEFDPADPTDVTGFLIAEDTGDGLTPTQITIGAGVAAGLDGSASIGGFDLIGAAGNLALSGPVDAVTNPEGLAQFHIGLDAAGAGPLGSVRSFTPTVSTTGGIQGDLDLTFLGRTVEDAVYLGSDAEFGIPLSSIGDGLSLDDIFTVQTDAISSLFTELDFDLLSILVGVDEFLGVLETELTGNLADAPIIGGGLEGIGEFIGGLKDNITEPLVELVSMTGSSFEEVAAFIDGEITSGLESFLGHEIGEDGVGVNLDSSTFEIIFDFAHSLELLSADFDTNVSFLPLETDGGIDVTLDFVIDVGIGVSRLDGVYLVAGSGEEISAGLAATIREGSSLELDLFLLSVSATKNGSSPELDGSIGLDFGSGKVGVDDILDNFVFSANATVALDLQLQATTALDLAEVSTQLVAGWEVGYDTTSGFSSSAATLALNDIQLNLGSFLGSTIKPIVEKLDEVIGPVRSVVDLLTTPIPGVSDLAELAGSPPVTLLDLALAQMAPDVANAARKFVSVIQSIDDVVGKINDLIDTEDPESDDLILNFGSISFGGDEEDDNNALLNGAFESDDPSETGDTEGLSDNPLSSLGSFASDVFSSISSEPTGSEEDDDGLGITFPIFDQPTKVVELLLGRTVDLVRWDIPTLSLGFGWSQRFPIFPVPPISVEVGLNAGFTIDLGIGLDTRGLQTGGLLDGFFLTDTEDDVDIDEFVFSLGVSLAALLDVGVASAGIEGEIRGELSANFRDPDENGKLYFDELARIIEEDGLICVFDLEARVRAILRVVFKVLFFEGSIDIVDVTLLEANNEGLCPADRPAHVSDGTEKTDDRFSNLLPEHLLPLVDEVMVDGQPIAPAGTLVVHAGAYASQRGGGASDTTEEFVLTQLAPGVIRVEGMGLSQEYAGVESVLFDGGIEADRLTLRLADDEEDAPSNPEFPLPVYAHGGDGNDVLHGGNQADQIYGGFGDDLLFGFARTDHINGNAGNDQLEGGDGEDELLGKAGADVINGGGGADMIFGGGARDEINGGSGDDTVYGNGGNDVIFGGAGDDNIEGDGGHDYIDGGEGDDNRLSGGQGNDYIIGGEGTDTLFGGWGNDAMVAHFIQDDTVGGNEPDYLEGGPDDDFICGSAGENIIHGGTADAGLASAGVELDQIIPLSEGGYVLTTCMSDAPPEPLASEDPVSFAGRVFRDRNGDGRRERTEPLFDGILVRIIDSENDVAAMVETGPIDIDGNGRINPETENGQWRVPNLEAGEYRIEVVLPPGFLQTAPSIEVDGSFDIQVDVAPGVDLTDMEFGLIKAPVIAGNKWLDLNGNGQRDAGEPGLPGIQIAADPLQRGSYVEGDSFTLPTVSGADNPETIEDETGDYSIVLSGPGTFTVTEHIEASGIVQPSDSSDVTTIQSFPRDIAIYENDFSVSSDDRWVNFGTGETPTPENSPSGEGLLGRFQNDVIQLTVDNVPPARLYQLQYDLHVIGSWLGYPSTNATTPQERFVASLQGASEAFLDTSFRTLDGAGAQDYPAMYATVTNEPRTGADDEAVNTLGYIDASGANLSATYRDITHTFSSEDSTLRFLFGATGLGTQGDSTWALDNVRVVAIDPAHRVRVDFEETRDPVDFGNAPVSEVHIIPVASPSADSSVETLPTAATEFQEDDDYFVELWVSGKNASVGVAAVSATLAYPADLTTAIEAVEFGPGFTPTISPTFEEPLADGPAIVGNLTAVREATGPTENYILFARIPFSHTADDSTPAGNTAPQMLFSRDIYPWLVDVEEYGGTNPYVYSATANLIVDPFDLNDDGSISPADTLPITDRFGDFRIDAGIEAGRIDIDDSGVIDLGDLALLVGELSGSAAGRSAGASATARVEQRPDATLPITLESPDVIRPIDAGTFVSAMPVTASAMMMSMSPVISGTYWNDEDGDGNQDPDEPVSAGITIYIDSNGNGVLDEGESSTVTGEDGSYAFEHDGEGTIVIREVLPPLATRTFPGSRPVAISPTGVLYDVDPTTGVTINPRQTSVEGIQVSDWIGIDYDPINERLVGIAEALESTGAASGTNMLYEIDPFSGDLSILDTFPPDSTLGSILEGDVAVSPDGTELYVLYRSVEIDKDTVLAIEKYNFASRQMSVVGALPLIENSYVDPSAMDFNAAGELLVLDAATNRIVNLNPSDASVNSTVTLSNGLIGQSQYAMRMRDDGMLLVVEGHPPEGEFDFGENYLIDSVSGALTRLARNDNNLSGLSYIPNAGHIVTLDETTSGPFDFGATQFKFIIDGADEIRGNGASDEIYGDNSVSDLLVISIGDDDLIVGGAGKDFLDGQEEDDMMWGGQDFGQTILANDSDENDIVIGNTGFDQILQIASANQRIDADFLVGQGTDEYFSIETATLYADDSGRLLVADKLTMDVTLIGGAGGDTLIGSAGNDVLDGGAGNDTLDGGNGDDTYRFTGSSSISFGVDTINESGSDKSDTIDLSGLDVSSSQVRIDADEIFKLGSSVISSAVFNDLENVIGTPGNDSIIGNGNNNRIDGGAGNDTIDALAGDDFVIGNTGDDTFVTSTDRDTFLFSAASAAESDSISLTGEEFTLDFSELGTDQSLVVDLTQSTMVQHLNRTVVVSGSFTSSDLDDVYIIGSAGADTFVDTHRNQRYTGNAGDDTYRFDGGSTSIDEVVETIGGGTDLIDLQFFSDDLYADFSDPTSDFLVGYFGGSDRVRADGVSHFENLTGGSGDDTLVGNASANQITGGAGDDILFGLEGDDRYVFANATSLENDQINEFVSQGNDTLDFQAIGNSLLLDFASSQATHTNRIVQTNHVENGIGGSDDDILIGDEADNQLIAGPGNDILRGGFGEDWLDGGTGDDRYEFEPLQMRTVGSGFVSEEDTISDSAGSGDTVDFSALGASDIAQLSISLGDPLVLANHNDDGITAFRRVIRADAETFIENAIGSEDDDQIVGNALDNELLGGGGNDILLGRQGNDLLDGGAGTNRLEGGRGSDRLRGFIGTNTLIGGPGNDVYSMDPDGPVNAVNTLIEAGGRVFGGVAFAGGSDTIVLPEIVDEFDLSSFDAAGIAVVDSAPGQSISIDLEIETGIRSGRYFENVITRDGDAKLTGNNRNNWLYGGSEQTGVNGKNILSGAGGADELAGGPDDDLFIDGTLQFTGGDDVDRIGLIAPMLEIQREWNRTIDVDTRLATITSTAADREIDQTLVEGGSLVVDAQADAIAPSAGMDRFLPNPPASRLASRTESLNAVFSSIGAEIEAGNQSVDSATLNQSEPDSSPNKIASSIEHSGLAKATHADPPAAAMMSLPHSLSVQLVPLTSPSAAGTTAPPVGLSTLESGQAFVVEVWVRSNESDAPGLTGMFLDLSYDRLGLAGNPDSVEIDDRFEILGDGFIHPSLGLIDDIGGATLSDDRASENSWVRLATVGMTAQSPGEHSILPLPGKVRPAQVGIGNVDWGDVELNSISLEVLPRIGVENASVNNGEMQRSIVSEVSVTFDREANAPASAFSITNRDTGVPLGGLMVTSALVDGKTVSTIRFSADASVILRENGIHSLIDGNYQLRVEATQISSADGGQFMEEDYVFGEQESDAFFRHFGDTDGDRDVDGQDYGRFGLTFLQSGSDPGYNANLDSDGDNDVDGQDYGRFGVRFLKVLDF